MQCFNHFYLEKFEKKNCAIFKRVLDIMGIKIGHLKGGNKWKSSGSLNSNWTLKGSKLLKGTGQNIIFSPKTRLI